jgi:hypothetical protein
MHSILHFFRILGLGALFLVLCRSSVPVADNVKFGDRLSKVSDVDQVIIYDTDYVFQGFDLVALLAESDVEDEASIIATVSFEGLLQLIRAKIGLEFCHDSRFTSVRCCCLVWQSGSSEEKKVAGVEVRVYSG